VEGNPDERKKRVFGEHEVMEAGEGGRRGRNRGSEWRTLQKWKVGWSNETHGYARPGKKKKFGGREGKTTAPK